MELIMMINKLNSVMNCCTTQNMKTDPLQATSANQVIMSQTQAPTQENRQNIWHGVLVWTERPENSNDLKMIAKQVPCHVSTNLSKEEELELEADDWPRKFELKLVPKQDIGNIDAYLKNSKSVLVHPLICEMLKPLTNIMSLGNVGLVALSKPGSGTPYGKLLILFYSTEKLTYLGYIPNDQLAFADRLRKMFQQRRDIETPKPMIGPNLESQNGFKADSQMPSTNTSISQIQQGCITSQTSAMKVKRRQITRRKVPSFKRIRRNQKNSKIPKSQKPTKQKGTKVQKRQRSEDSTPESFQGSKRPRTEELTIMETFGSEEIAVVCADYPATQMEPDKLKAVETSILEAYDNITEQELQVRFAKCIHRPGYLIVTCADTESAQWLRNTVLSLEPWEGGSLTTLGGKDVPKSWACTVFVPDEEGQKLEAKRILRRLKISNRNLKTYLWIVWSSSPAEKGTLWTFFIDRESMEEIKKLGMCPYFGMGKLRLLIQDGDKKTSHEKTSGESSKSTDQTTMVESQRKDEAKTIIEAFPQEGQPSKREVCELKRPAITERVAPTEKDEVIGEGLANTVTSLE